MFHSAKIDCGPKLNNIVEKLNKNEKWLKNTFVNRKKFFVFYTFYFSFFVYAFLYLLITFIITFFHFYFLFIFIFIFFPILIQVLILLKFLYCLLKKFFFYYLENYFSNFCILIYLFKVFYFKIFWQFVCLIYTKTSFI